MEENNTSAEYENIKSYEALMAKIKEFEKDQAAITAWESKLPLEMKAKFAEILQKGPKDERTEDKAKRENAMIAAQDGATAETPKPFNLLTFVLSIIFPDRSKGTGEGIGDAHDVMDARPRDIANAHKKDNPFHVKMSDAPAIGTQSNVRGAAPTQDKGI